MAHSHILVLLRKVCQVAKTLAKSSRHKQAPMLNSSVGGNLLRVMRHTRSHREELSLRKIHVVSPLLQKEAKRKKFRGICGKSGIFRFFPQMSLAKRKTQIL